MVGVKVTRTWLTVAAVGVALALTGATWAEDDPDTLLEQEKALAAEQAPLKVGNPSPGGGSGMAMGAPVQYPLFVGLDDALLDAYTIDPILDVGIPVFTGVEVWGAAFDSSANRVYVSDGVDLYEWFVGDPAPTLIGTIQDSTMTSVSMEGLAWYDGVLYASKVGSTGEGEGIYQVDPATLSATRVIAYVNPAATTISGIDADPDTGIIYGTNDNSALRGLVEIAFDGTVTLVTPYTGSESDVDGLAVGGGKAYLITDDQTPPEWDVWDFAAGAYTGTVTSPYTTTEVFAGGAWIFEPGPGGATHCDSPALAIPDNDPLGATTSIVVGDNLTIEDLDVFIDAAHTWSGDLIFTLTHVDTATSITLVDRPGYTGTGFGCSGNDYFVTVDDEGPDVCIEDQCADAPAIFGSAPGGDPCSTTLMQAFDGEDLNGTWELTVSDNAGGDTGTLNEWCLVVNGGTINPAISLVKTVGTTPGVCAATDTITVPAGTEVYYCYEVSNIGDVSFDVHDLVDSELGTILSGFSYVLDPGTSATVLDVNAIITVDTTNTATWTARITGGPSATAEASATVNVTFPDIAVNPASMFASQLTDEITTQQLTVENQGAADLTWSIVEAPAGTIRAGNGLPLSAAPVDVPAAAMPAEPIDCAVYENYAGREPAGYADQCLGGIVPRNGQPQTGFGPTDMGYALDIGFVSDNFVSFTLNDFPGQTVVGQNAQAIFGMDFDSTLTTLYGLDNDLQSLGTIDTATGAWTTIGLSVPVAGHNLTGLAVDPSTNLMYASSTDGADSVLYSVDPATGALTQIGSMGTALMIDISISPTGVMYGHDIGDDTIYTIDMGTGAATAVGLTGYNANFAQGMDFDNDDGTLYIFLYLGGGANVYGTVDLATGAVTPLATDNPTGEFEGATATGGVCSNPQDIPWLSVAPTAGSNPPATNTVVDVTFDSTGVAVGIYDATLCVLSNDPDESVIQVPVTMEVVIPVELMSIEIE